MMANRVAPPLNPDRALQAYVIGLAIGDGNLSNPNGRAVRLRITCDTKYPILISKISTALRELLPKNRVNIVYGNGNYVNVSVYSNHLEGLLGWKASGGSKARQGVSIPEWIFKDRALTICCLRGLIETDGAIYQDRGYPMVIFSTIIPLLASQVHAMICALGYAPRLYSIDSLIPNFSRKFQVRLSREVRTFLELVQPAKS